MIFFGAAVRFFLLTSFLLTGFLLTGCSGTTGAGLAEVTGKITFNGRAVPTRVIFQPLDERANITVSNNVFEVLSSEINHKVIKHNVMRFFVNRI